MAALEILKRDWDKYEDEFPVSNFDDVLNDLPSYPIIEDIVRNALRQAEETFCDFVGLCVFGSAYMYAFAYLLSGFRGNRPPYYPKMTVRARNIEMAGKKLGCGMVNEFPSLFDDKSTIHQHALQGVIDGAGNAQTDGLIEAAEDAVSTTGTPKTNREEIERIRKLFE